MSDIFSALLSTLSDAGEGAARGYVRSLNPLGAVIRAGQAAGLSGRQILRSYREIGGTISNATFWDLRRSINQSPPTAATLTSLLGGDTSGVASLPGGRAGVYRLDFQVHVQRLGPDGEKEYTTTQFSMLQRQLDVEGAMQAMSTQVLPNNSDPESESGQWLGFELVGVSQYSG